MGASGNDFNLQSNLSATSAQFTLLLGGPFMVTAVATWNSGGWDLQILSGDGTTWQNVGTSTNLTTNAVVGPVYLPPGQYKWTMSGTPSVGYLTLTRIQLG